MGGEESGYTSFEGDVCMLASRRREGVWFSLGSRDFSRGMCDDVGFSLFNPLNIHVCDTASPIAYVLGPDNLNLLQVYIINLYSG